MEILIVKNNYKYDGVKFRIFTSNKIIILLNDNTYYIKKISEITDLSCNINCIKTIYTNYLFKMYKLYKIKNLTIQEYDMLNSNDLTVVDIGINYVVPRYRWKSITKKEFKLIRNEYINI
jgi:hypothetical protein